MWHTLLIENLKELSMWTLILTKLIIIYKPNAILHTFTKIPNSQLTKVLSFK